MMGASSAMHSEGSGVLEECCCESGTRSTGVPEVSGAGDVEGAWRGGKQSTECARPKHSSALAALTRRIPNAKCVFSAVAGHLAPTARTRRPARKLPSSANAAQVLWDQVGKTPRAKHEAASVCSGVDGIEVEGEATARTAMDGRSPCALLENSFIAVHGPMGTRLSLQPRAYSWVGWTCSIRRRDAGSHTPAMKQGVIHMLNAGGRWTKPGGWGSTGIADRVSQ